jgi:hypothetical protein
MVSEPLGEGIKWVRIGLHASLYSRITFLSSL